MVRPEMKTAYIYRHSARLLLSHHRILLRVTRNELKAKYAGSVLGMGWIALAPLVLLAVYGVVYLFIFRVRVPELTPLQYVLYIFSGLVPFLATAEACAAGVPAVVANRAVLNNTVFPIDLAAPKAVLMSQASMVVGLSVILLMASATRTLAWTALLLPVVWVLQILALIGINWVLSLVYLVFRDLQYLISIILMILLIASPIAYTPHMVPAKVRMLLIFNPFAYFVMCYQKILVLGQIPGLSEGLMILAFSFGAFALGGWFFSRAKRVMIDYV